MNLMYPRISRGALAILAVAIGAWGCAEKDAASYIQSAKDYIAKNDYKAAIIELKNAVQKNPDEPDTRFLLGKALLAAGDAAGAETEVRKAIALHASDDLTYPLLAEAMLTQGNLAKATKELGSVKLSTPHARAELNATLAAAEYVQGNAQAGGSYLAAAVSDEPTNPRVLLLQSQAAGQAGDLASARRLIETGLQAAPDDVNLLLYKSQLDISEDKREVAQQTIERAIDKHPDSITARSALLGLAVRSNNIELAKAQLEKMKQLSLRDVRTMYADALVAYYAGDYAHSRDAVQSVLGVTPQHLPSLLLSGLVNLQLQSFAPAEEALRKVLNRAPDNQMAVRALAAMYMRTGRTQQALEVLTPALRAAPNDPALLRMVGEAQLASGNAAAAAEAYERANALDKGNVRNDVRLAQVRLAAGETARAFNDLEALAAKSEPNQDQADLALFTAHLRRREFDQALAIADRLEKKDPKRALPYSLRGIAYLNKRDLKAARASFDKALQTDPDYYAAAYNLAVIDMQEGNPRAARERYESILKKNPKNEQAMLALADVLVVSGGTRAEISGLLDKAVAANPASSRARLAVIRNQMREKDYKAAIATAQAGLNAVPNEQQLIEAMGAAQLAAGDGNQAVETFRRLAVALPQNPLVMLRLSYAQAAVKDYASAIDSVHKALVIKPDLDQAWAALARTYIAWGRPEGAIAEARKLQKEQPTKALGYAIEGEIDAAQRKWPDAVTAFRTGLSKQPSPILAARLYTALQAAGKADEAAAMAAKWVKDNPKDATMRQMMAEQSQRRGDVPGAIAGYQQVLDISPDSPVALNNIAWLLVQNNDPKALDYAEQAHRLAPFNPSVLDTLGYVLTKQGDPKRGLQMLTMASTLAPARSEIRLHFAQALVATGNKAEARKQLTELVKLDKGSPIRGEAEKLLATL